MPTSLGKDTSSMAITILYRFENDHCALYEIERTDVADSTDKAKRFVWLRCDQGQAPKRLTFVAMHPEDEFQYREFAEGELQFNDTLARFRSEGTARYETFTVQSAADDIDEALRTQLSQAIEQP